jgi:DNA-directed RNA polymerase specialized sigma24 family protein
MPADFPDTRWSLVARAEGDAAPLLALYAEPVARYLAMKFPDAARDGRLDDLVQDVLAWMTEHPEVLARARPDAAVAGGSRFRWFVMTLAFNAARNALRRLGRVATDEAAAEALAAPAVEPQAAAEMDRAWAAALLAAAWRDLAGWAASGVCEADVPNLLRGHLLDGQGVRELAEANRLSLGTCHRRLARGRALLRQAITDRLRASGEVPPDDDGVAVCDLLLELLRR